MGADYLVWGMIEMLVFYDNVYYSDASSFYDWGTVADFPVYFDVGMG